MAYEEKYVKLLEERVEELQQRLSDEQKRTAPLLTDNELVKRYIASQIQINCGSHIPATYRYTPAKCETKAKTSSTLLCNIVNGAFKVEQKYIDYVEEAMRKIDAEKIK